MNVRDVDGLNVGYAQGLLEQYLENPEAVPEEWRALFESGDAGLAESLPGLARLLATLREENGAPAAAEIPAEIPAVAAREAAPAPPAEVPAPVPKESPLAEAAPSAERARPITETDQTLLGAVAAAMALVRAYRTHGHLAARLDPLGSEPVGDPALEPEWLVPKLTPELQAQVPASVLRVWIEGKTLADIVPRL
jgi:2-oxoglutarate dehydrogenase complex dehydrogenase (E1) component-like enzyme